MRHKPTGLSVFINGRDQGQNKKEALRILTAKVNSSRSQAVRVVYDEHRKTTLVGGSCRGTKRRTYNFILSRVADHELGLKTRNIKEFFKGNFAVLFESTERDEE